MRTGTGKAGAKDLISQKWRMCWEIPSLFYSFFFMARISSKGRWEVPEYLELPDVSDQMFCICQAKDISLCQGFNFLWISSSWQCLFPLFSAGAPAALPLGKEEFQTSTVCAGYFQVWELGLQSQNFLSFGKGKKQNISISISLYLISFYFTLFSILYVQIFLPAFQLYSSSAWKFMEGEQQQFSCTSKVN